MYSVPPASLYCSLANLQHSVTSRKYAYHQRLPQKDRPRAFPHTNGPFPFPASPSSNVQHPPSSHPPANVPRGNRTRLDRPLLSRSRTCGHLRDLHSSRARLTHRASGESIQHAAPWDASPVSTYARKDLPPLAAMRLRGGRDGSVRPARHRARSSTLFARPPCAPGVRAVATSSLPTHSRRLAFRRGDGRASAGSGGGRH